MLLSKDRMASFSSVKQFAFNLNKYADSFRERLDVIVRHNK